MPNPITSPTHLRSRQSGLWSILIAVGLIGLLITAWVSRALDDSAQERLAQRFHLAAASRASLVTHQIQNQLDQLITVQRLFGSVNQVDWPSFQRFVEPMVGQHGVRGYGWMPVVEAADRPDFERAGRQLWGDNFAITERDPQGNDLPVVARARYFPVLYAVPIDLNRRAIGLNLHAAANRGPVIDQAIDSGLPTASQVSLLIIDKQQTDTVVVMAPVYRGGVAPSTGSAAPPKMVEARRSAVLGIAMAVISIGKLFEAANDSTPDTGLHVRLLDQTPAGEQNAVKQAALIGHWRSRLPKADVANVATNTLADAAVPTYTEDFEVAGRHWLVQVEASPVWIETNASRSIAFVPLVGTLGTLLLLFYLHGTLARRQSAEALVVERTSALAERQKAYETLVEHLPDIICRYDHDYRYVFTNAAFARLPGLPQSDVLGKTVRDAFASYPGIEPALITQWEAVLREVYETKRSQHVEFGFPTLAGPRFFDGVLVPEPAPDGSDGTVLGIFHEVTERQAAEAWAHKLSLAVEQNPATIVITDLEGRIEYVNEKFVETSGYTKAEAIGHNPRLFKSGRTSERTYAALWGALKAGRAWKGELENRRRDGSLYWERSLISPIQDSRGKVTNYVAIKEDVSELRQTVDRLHESEALFRGVVTAMAEGLLVFAADGTLVFANRSAEEVIGAPGGALRGATSSQLDLERIHEDGTLFAHEDWPTVVAMRERREVRDVVMGLRFPDQSVRWVLANASPLIATGDGTTTAAVVTFTDITERRRAEEQLQLAFEAINHSGEGIMVTDALQRIISVNPAFEKVTGYVAAEVLGKTPGFFASGRHDDAFYREMYETLETTGYWQGEIWNRRKNAEIFPEWLGISAVRENDGRTKHYVAIFSDITERKAAQQHIEFLAHHDALTGLPNRLLLRDRLDQASALASRQQSRIALLFLDLDRFKMINDSLGHPVGDALLKAVVERLKRCVRDADTISRQGGDEFVIVLGDVRDSEAVARIAEKIHQRMAEPFVIDNHALTTSFSIGIALYPDDGEDFDTLTKKADTAMYHAKQAGRNTHRFFAEQMNVQAVEHLQLENRLRLALKNNEFVLHYQPQLDLREGTIVGVEALIRWVSPDGGLIPPGKFIPIAEESGLIVPIGAWVLGEACRQARAWQDAGLPPFVVAVNLSAMQFRRQDLVNTVINALVLADLDAQWLELELTESILIQDAEMTLDTVRRLKAIGVQLSVDDFGTGYSSLAYLKRFAVDKLKIDQSFIRDLVSDPDDAAIVRAIVQMAHSLKLKTIAEGVETAELADHLRLFHCDEIQGYWFARPMPADELAAFVREKTAAS